MAIKSPSPNKKPNNLIRLSLFWTIIVFGILAVFAITTPRDSLKEVSISTVIQQANAGQIAKIEIQGDQLKVTPKGSPAATEQSTKQTGSSIQDQGLNKNAKVELSITQPDRKSVV